MNQGSRRTRSSQISRSSSSRSRGSRTQRPPIKGTRSSVKAVAERQVKRKGAVNSRNLKRVRKSHQKLATALLVIGIFVVIACACAAALISQNDNAKYAACEQYRSTVQQACKDCDLDPDWTDCLLAAMLVESGGDKEVKSVLNVKNDIMQAAEGAYGWIVKNGWPKQSIKAQTIEASVYAGVMEFKQNLDLWEDYLGPITPDDTTEIELVIQGYNFGAEGWLAWCKAKGVRAYTVELAQEYSDTKMPADAKGTPTHAQKWLAAYETIRGNH